MAIAKKGNVDFLNGLNAASIDTTKEESVQSENQQSEDSGKFR